MRKFLLYILLITQYSCYIFAEQKVDMPKLVVGVVVDQMRWDYLQFYYHSFSEDGLKRILNNGFSCNNVFINYIPTVTACGHSSIYAGSTPAFTGIAGNNFYIGTKKVYCTDDDNVKTVGNDSKIGNMSPRKMHVTTMCDMLRLSNNFKSRTYGVSLKDRGAILPAGHSANAAYWFDSKNGEFVSSTYYMPKLPIWVRKFNEKNKVLQDVRYSPQGNTITEKMAKAIINGENLGKGDYTDFLAISFSSTDYIGHKYGTRSVMTDSAYLQLDKDIADLLSFLDEKIGNGNYLLFLTADHGASHNNMYLKKHNIPAGTIKEDELLDSMNCFMKLRYRCSQPLIKDLIENRIYLDKNVVNSNNLDIDDVKKQLTNYLENKEEIVYAVDYESLKQRTIPPAIANRIIMGYDPERSGDIIIIPATGYYGINKSSFVEGTTHSVWNPYDTHIPLLFFGWNVPYGVSAKEQTISDIAPTICSMLNIQQPNGCIGNVISFNN
jgi:predicted AlkP superfamily pyrophosphatase or phosphodiesterase